MPERTYTLFEFASLFGKSPRTIRNWVKKGWARPLAVRTKPMIFSESEVLRIQHSVRVIDVFA